VGLEERKDNPWEESRHLEGREGEARITWALRGEKTNCDQGRIGKRRR
jgi:hypothetical protein